jgi:hypothetical protein
VAVLAALAASSSSGDEALLAFALGIGGAALLAAAVLLRWPSAVLWGIVASGAGFLVGRHGIDVGTALAGAALLLAAELAHWSIEDDRRIAVDRPVTVRRATVVGAVTVAGFAVDLVLDAATSLRAPSGVLLAALGVAAMVGSFSLLAALARRA